MKKKVLCTQRFRYIVSDIKDSLISEIGDKITSAKINVRISLMSSKADTPTEIESYIKNIVPIVCKKQAELISQSIDTAVQSLIKAFSEVMDSYHKDFERQFHKLGILKINIDNISINTPKVQAVSLSSLKEALDYMANEVSKENWAVGAGGVTGAAIGTAILPGVGTVVGGILGMFVGAMNTPSSEEMKNKAYDKLSGPLDTVFQSVERDIIATFNDNVTIYESAILKEIYRYLEKYKSAVDRRIADHNSLMTKNQEQTSKVMVDLKLITLRRKQLKALTETLN